MIYPASIFCVQHMRAIMRHDDNGREYHKMTWCNMVECCYWAVSTKFAAPRPQAGNRGDRLANEAFAGHVGFEKFSHNYIGCDCSHMQIDFHNMQFQYFWAYGGLHGLKSCCGQWLKDDAACAACWVTPTLLPSYLCPLHLYGRTSRRAAGFGYVWGRVGDGLIVIRSLATLTTQMQRFNHCNPAW